MKEFEFLLDFADESGVLYIGDEHGGSVLLDDEQTDKLLIYLQNKSKVRAERMFQQEVGMRALEEAMWKKYQDKVALVPSEAEIAALLEPTPYDSGTCTCGQHVEAGRLHAHRCVSEDERIESRTWEWEERRYEQERLAYCGWEEF